MIYGYTGLNGTGKTSNVLWMFLNDPAYKDRPKYATHILGFDYEKHGVTKLDLEGLKKWRECPIGSVFLVDEAQDFFPIQRGQPEPWIADLAKNRHGGYDFLLTTPNASMINHYVRALVNRHTHFIMKHGAIVSALKWDKIQKDPDSKTARDTGEPVTFNTPDDVFKLYTSTKLDTRQIKVPKSTLITIGLCASLIAAAIIYVVFFSGLAKKDAPVPAAEPVKTLPAPAKKPFPMPASSALALPGQQGGEQRTAAYYQPRIASDPSSAPMYDHLTQATDFPRIAACVKLGDTTCRCFTQQGTPWRVHPAICDVMVKEGWFDNWKTGRAQAEFVLSGRSDEAAAITQNGQTKPEPIIIGADTPAPRIADAGYQSIYAKNKP